MFQNVQNSDAKIVQMSADSKRKTQFFCFVCFCGYIAGAGQKNAFAPAMKTPCCPTPPSMKNPKLRRIRNSAPAIDACHANFASSFSLLKKLG